MRLLSAAAVVGLALELMSGTARAAVITQMYRFELKFSDSSAPIKDISGSFDATFNPYIDSSLKVTDFTSNLPASYSPTTFHMAAYGTYEVIQFGNACYPGGCGVTESYDQYFVSFIVDTNGRNPNNVLAAYTSSAMPNSTYSPSTSSVSAVPVPKTAPLFGAALLALGAVGYGVKAKKAAATG